MAKRSASSDPEAYQQFLDLVKKRHSVRKFKRDPIPREYPEKILEAARWAMSGANAQPWEFIVVRRRRVIKALYAAFKQDVLEYNFWCEQMVRKDLQHNVFTAEARPQDKLRELLAHPGWSEAPTLIAVLGDGRRQLASVMGAHTPGRGLTHLTDALSNVSQMIHLAAASLGIGSQWVTVHIQEPLKRILGVPDVLTLHSLVALGYPAGGPGGSYRRRLKEMIHYDRYDREKYMRNQDVIEFIGKLRKRTRRSYSRSRGDSKR
jgi:5,6-dimethylbenzimidazole synthase